MRRRWCTSVAILALVGGSMLTASGATAATASAPGYGHLMPQPGGLARHLTGPFGAPGRGPDAQTSANWSGYAAHGGTYTSVSASWVQPAAHCSSGNQLAAFWVGLDGYSTTTVEQTGTLSGCQGSTPVYAAWWEMFPAGSHDFSNPVSPGDQFTASVTYDGGGRFTLKISDTTQGWSHTEQKTLASARRRSAEVIIEAPSSNSALLPLADFGTVHITDAMVNGSAIGSHSPTEIIMKSGGTQKDSVSTLSGGENFSATWLHK